MTSAPRPELNRLIAALERHLEASTQRRGEDDPTVIAAYEDLADAFEAYDDALHEATGEMTPLIVVDEDVADGLGIERDDDGGSGGDDRDDDGDDTDEDYDEDEGDQSYSGLDDEEYDADERG